MRAADDRRLRCAARHPGALQRRASGPPDGTFRRWSVSSARKGCRRADAPAAHRVLLRHRRLLEGRGGRRLAVHAGNRPPVHGGEQLGRRAARPDRVDACGGALPDRAATIGWATGRSPSRRTTTARRHVARRRSHRQHRHRRASSGTTTVRAGDSPRATSTPSSWRRSTSTRTPTRTSAASPRSRSRRPAPSCWTGRSTSSRRRSSRACDRLGAGGPEPGAAGTGRLGPRPDPRGLRAPLARGWRGWLQNRGSRELSAEDRDRAGRARRPARPRTITRAGRPAAATHRVKPGQTLTGIAEQYGVSLAGAPCSPTGSAPAARCGRDRCCESRLLTRDGWAGPARSGAGRVLVASQARMRTHPVFLCLEGRRCVAVGGDAGDRGQGRACRRAGADVTVIAARSHARAPRAGRARARSPGTGRDYRLGDLRGALLAYASTRDPERIRALRAEAAARARSAERHRRAGGVLRSSLRRCWRAATCRSRSAPGAPARRWPRACGDELETTVGPEYAPLVAILGAVRRALRGGRPGGGAGRAARLAAPRSAAAGGSAGRRSPARRHRRRRLHARAARRGGRDRPDGDRAAARSRRALSRRHRRGAHRHCRPP